MDLDQAIEAQYDAMRAIARGDPEPTKALYSDADDVTLANPWGPAVLGRSAVCEMLDFVGTRFRDGDMEGVERLAAYIGSDIATTHRERALAGEGWRPGRALALRAARVVHVPSRGRHWKLVLRHADPISAARAGRSAVDGA